MTVLVSEVHVGLEAVEVLNPVSSGVIVVPFPLPLPVVVVDGSGEGIEI